MDDGGGEYGWESKRGVERGNGKGEIGNRD